MNSKTLIAKTRFITYLSGYERRIYAAAELAQVSRDADTLARIASLGLGSLSAFCEAVGLNRTGNVRQAERLAHDLIQCGPSGFKAKALVLLANNRQSSDPDSALKLYDRAQTLVDDPNTALTVIKMRAIVISNAFADHKSALQALERGIQSLRFCDPVVRADFLNSLAVESIKVGRLDQARHLCEALTLSPWAKLYSDEWQDTADSLRAADPSRAMSVHVPRPKATILKFTAATREPPGVQTTRLRIRARAAVSRITDIRLLDCLAKLGTLPAENRELLIRTQDIEPAVAEALTRYIDKQDSLQDNLTSERQG